MWPDLHFFLSEFCVTSQFLNVGMNYEVHMQSPELRRAPRVETEIEEPTGHTPEGTGVAVVGREGRVSKEEG